MRDTLQAMTLEKAQGIVKEIVSARKKWGKLVSVPYTQAQIYDALLVLDAAGNFDGGSKEDVTKLRRQLAACENRTKRLSKKYQDVTQPLDATNENDYGND